MTLLDHLIELRKYLLYCIVTVLVIFLCLLPFSATLYYWISLPIVEQLPANSSMIATDVTATFFAPFKLTLISAFFLSIPVILFQIWRFIAPGLYATEKKILFPVIILSISLFYSGIAFAYIVIFPVVMHFFTSISPENVVVTPDISQYLSIALKLFFAFGLAFQIPVFISVIIATGISSVNTLKSKRPYIIVACFIIGMLLTPPDPFSQIMLAVPMYLLFELGLLSGRLFNRRTTHKK